MSSEESTSKVDKSVASDSKDLHTRRFCGFRTTKHGELVIFTLIGVFLGITMGFLLRHANLSEEMKTVISFPGELLLRMLKMLVIPLITTSIITGVTKLFDGKSGKVGLQIILYYVLTTFCSVLIGIVMVLTIKPGCQRQVNFEAKALRNENVTFSALDSFLDIIRNLFPKNLVEAWFRVESTKVVQVMKEVNNASKNSTVQLVKTLESVDGTNALGLITFCIMIGLALNRKSTGSRPLVLLRFFEELYTIFMDIMMKIMWYAPLGICSLIAGNLVRVENMLSTFRTLGLYMTTMFVGLLLHSMVVLPLIYFIATRKNPFRVYIGSVHALLAIFGTNSSAATLPVTIRCAEENLKIDKRFTRVMLPLGATINMDGTAMFQGVAAVTIAQMNGISLSFGEVITVWLTGTMAGIGAAAVPGSGLVVVLFVLQSVGIPSEALGLLYTVDWLVERMRGPVNIMGDEIGVCLVSHFNHSLQDNIPEFSHENSRLDPSLV